jgi:hypothetical protein
MPENKVQITIEAIDKAKAALDAVAKDLGKIREETQKTGQESRGLGGVLASLKESWIGISIGINQALEIISKVRQAGAAVYDFAKEGQKVILVETAFKHMTQSVGADGDAMIERLKAITKGVMDDTDLMKNATEMMLAGVKPDQVEKLTDAMMKLAPYAGMTLPEGMQRLGTALESGNARTIRAITGYIDLNYELEVYAQRLGRTADQLTDVARVQATGEIVLGRMNQKTKDLTATHELGINTFLRFEAAWKNMIEDMQKGVGPLSELVQWLTKLIEKFNEFSQKRKETQEEWEARKEFARTPQGEAMLGAIGTVRGQGYEKAFQDWYAQQKKIKEYQLAIEAQDRTLAARTGPAAAGEWKPPTRLEDLQKQAALIQSINDEETKRKAALDVQAKMMKMQVKGITDQEVAEFKGNELAKINNEFSAKRLMLQAAILKEQGFSVEALETQKEAELTLTTNAKDRLELTKKWNLEIEKAISERAEKRLAAMPDVSAAFGAGWIETGAEDYKETMIGEQTALEMAMSAIGRKESELQERRKIDQEEINLLRAQGFTAEADYLEDLAKVVDLTDELNIIGEKISATEGVERDHWINIYALKEQNLEATKRTLAVQEKMTEAVAEFYIKYKELTGVVLPGMESALASLLEKEMAAYKGIIPEEQIEKMREKLATQMRIDMGTAGPGESFLYGWKQMEVEWGNSSKNMVEMARDSAEAMRQGFEDGFFSLMTGKFKDLGQVAKAFLTDLQRIIARVASKQLESGTLSLFGWLFGGGSGGYTGASNTTYYGPEGPYGIMHAGHPGPVTYRLLPSPTFFGARRHHTGLAGGEVPAILKDDEWVFTKEQIAGLGRAIGRARESAPAPQVNQTLTIHIPINGLSDPKLESRLRSNLEKTVKSTVLRTLEEHT